MIRCRIKPQSRPDRGFYFAAPLDRSSRDVFVHATVLPTEEPLEVGQLVDLEYETEPDGRLRAVFVEPVER